MHSLTHLIVQSFIHSLIHSPTLWLTNLPILSLVFTHSFTHLFIHSLAPSFTYSLTNSLINSLSHLHIHPFITPTQSPFALSSIQLFAICFINHSFTDICLFYWPLEKRLSLFWSKESWPNYLPHFLVIKMKERLTRAMFKTICSYKVTSFCLLLLKKELWFTSVGRFSFLSKEDTYAIYTL